MHCELLKRMQLMKQEYLKYSDILGVKKVSSVTDIRNRLIPVCESARFHASGNQMPPYMLHRLPKLFLDF